jgi:hypothetical protein
VISIIGLNFIIYDAEISKINEKIARNEVRLNQDHTYVKSNSHALRQMI